MALPPMSPRQDSGVRAEADGHLLMLRARDGRCYRLNPTAMAVWELCDGTTRIDEMVDAICELATLPRSVVDSDVHQLLHELSALGLLLWDAGQLTTSRVGES